jgi:hypothetical protein
MARRLYDEADKSRCLAVLDANGGNVKKTARDTGFPRSTVREWSQGRGVPEAAAAAVPLERGNLADELEARAWELVGALPGKIASASLAQTGTVLGIVIDKCRVLRGEPTAITEDVTAARETLDSKLAQLRARAGAPAVSLEPDGSGGEAAPL